MRHLPGVAAVLVAAGLALSACAAPQFTYVTDSADGAYFKVPRTWKPIDQHLLEQVQAEYLSHSPAGAAGGPYIWARAYDASRDPSALHIFSSSSAPVVYASVQELNPTERASLSFNSMRDLLLPVTPEGRTAARQAGAKLKGFQSIEDETVTTSDGTRGINEIFEYQLGTLPEVFDQTVLTNAETTKLYLLLVQCDQSCFIANKAQIAAVVQSFTVRGS